ncbi:hypothetical protein C7446_0931 [Kushneria sinocarnis]|uniref:EamA-like transporter family protein n=1 Tax=Kushneria sinocarnis TaxID=595502 RepID=A0A420WZZ8_9GAMM|nr:hypothetical protein [Kushneria sinocarnis]RKR06931.1 hypothetical protein C7446_0931 [Kushneria sinocarnis]
MAAIAVICGLLGALGQALYYFLAAQVRLTTGLGSRAMLVFSHLLMGLGSAIGVIMLWSPDMAPLMTLLGPLAAASGCYLLGQAALFAALRHDVASRVSPLLGLKVVSLAVITTLFAGELLGRLEWLGVAICGLAAIAMSLAGGAIRSRALGWLLLAVLGYSASDLGVVALMHHIGVEGLHGIMLAVSVVYCLNGLVVLPVGFSLGRADWRRVLATWPLAASWMGSMVLLFVTFNVLGAVHANILQSARGILSIAVALVMTRLGIGLTDALSRGRLFYQRLACATAMAVGIIIFQLG